MARSKKSQANRRSLVSDKRFSIDRAGRKRIGGKFASARQIAAWKSARSRRGLSTQPQTASRSSAKSQARNRSLISRKAAATRKLNDSGVEKLDEFRTPEANFLKITYSLPEISAALTESIAERVVLDHKTFAINYVLDIRMDTDDEADDLQTIGTPFALGALNGNVRSLDIETASQAALDMVERYGVFSVDAVTLVISPRR